MSMRNPVDTQPIARNRKLVKSITEPMMLQMGSRFTTQSSALIVSPLKQIFELDGGVSRSQPIIQTAKPYLGQRMGMLEPATYVVPKYDPFSDWRLAIGVQHSRILNLKPTHPVLRSRSKKLILPATFLSPESNSSAVYSTPSPVAHFQVAKPDLERRIGILEPGTYLVPKSDPLSDWRLAVGVQPSCILTSPTHSVSRSRSKKLILPATLPSPDSNSSAVYSTPSPVPHLISDASSSIPPFVSHNPSPVAHLIPDTSSVPQLVSHTPSPVAHLISDTSSFVPHFVSDTPSPKKRHVKLQSIQAKLAKQAQQLKEASFRASSAAKVLRNTWTHGANFRRLMKAKGQAEKTLRFFTDEFQATRKEEVNTLSKLEKKRRRQCERWTYARVPSDDPDGETI